MPSDDLVPRRARRGARAGRHRSAGLQRADRRYGALATGCPATAPRPGSSTATAPPATLPAAADGTDVGACVDGDCEILVSAQTEIPMDGTLRVDRLSIAVDAGKVTIRAYSQGSMSRITTGSGATGRLNQLAVEVVAVSDGMAVLRLSPAAAR